MFNNTTIMVTGGTGFFGQAFCRKILKSYKIKKIIIYSRDEFKQFNMSNDIFFKKNKSKIRYFIGDVRDLERLKSAMSEVDYVVHTSALKHVVSSEYNPFETIKTNIIGAQNVIDASIYNRVKKVVALSTDKAASPVNLYGATKLASDKLFVAANNYIGLKNIKFSVVRYGNVMGSRGSVIPLFLSKTKEKYITVTHEEMTRFNITLNESINFVIKSFRLMKGSEIFVPKTPSYHILDLVKAINPKAKIKIIGIRKGEKLHEELITKNDAFNTLEYKDYYVIYPHLEKKNFFIGKKCKKNFAYTSQNNKDFLKISQLKKLIAENIINKSK
tara:strand:+ start:7020 stop:8009 length:990 start_codon:yes stop_codon:yes gene_type:complete